MRWLFAGVHVTGRMQRCTVDAAGGGDRTVRPGVWPGCVSVMRPRKARGEGLGGAKGRAGQAQGGTTGAVEGARRRVPSALGRPTSTRLHPRGLDVCGHTALGLSGQTGRQRDGRAAAHSPADGAGGRWAGSPWQMSQSTVCDVEDAPRGNTGMARPRVMRAAGWLVAEKAAQGCVLAVCRA